MKAITHSQFSHKPTRSSLFPPRLCRGKLPAPQFAIRAPRFMLGFTLIELMTVLAIIMILAGLIVAGAKYAMTKAGRSRAEAEIAAMENALENYKNDYGVYPPSTTTRFQVAAGPAGLAEINNSVALYAALAGGTKVYMTFKPNQIHLDAANKPYIVDPFGSPYNYYCTQPVAANQQNQATFDLWS